MIVDRFITVLADTAEAREIHFNIRYRVFCEETGFEDRARFPERMERDASDAYARHFVVWDRAERRWAAAMRLVTTDWARHSSEDIIQQPDQGLGRGPRRMLQFSRLCMLRDYRHTSSALYFGLYQPEASMSGELIPVFYRQENGEMLLRLLYGVLAWTGNNGFGACFCNITPALARILVRTGIPLTRAGNHTDHSGSQSQALYYFGIQEAKAGLVETLPGFARIVQTSPGYVPYSDLMAGRCIPNFRAVEPRPTERPGTGKANVEADSKASRSPAGQR